MEPLQPSNFRRQLHKARVATNEVGHNRAEQLVLERSERTKTKVERRKKGSNYSKRAENAELSKTIGATASRHPDPRRGEGSSPAQSKLENLERQMKEAAARLDFEEAARIRDIIRSMDG